MTFAPALADRLTPAGQRSSEPAVPATHTQLLLAAVTQASPAH